MVGSRRHITLAGHTHPVISPCEERTCNGHCSGVCAIMALHTSGIPGSGGSAHAGHSISSRCKRVQRHSFSTTEDYHELLSLQHHLYSSLNPSGGSDGSATDCSLCVPTNPGFPWAVHARERSRLPTCVQAAVEIQHAGDHVGDVC